jgi:hypothetical protein
MQLSSAPEQVARAGCSLIRRVYRARVESDRSIQEAVDVGQLFLIGRRELYVGLRNMDRRFSGVAW